MTFQNIIKKDNFLKIINFILIAFLLIEPVFDLKIFYNSISTLIRVIVFGILFLFYFFIIDKNKKKYLLLIYPFLLIIYIFFHHINAMHFNSLVPGNFNYSLQKEILYFVKMTVPFILIYILYVSQIDKNKIINVIKYIVLIMGLIIIISNIFGFSYSSYNDLPIKANFFKWFNHDNNYTYQDLSSKGLFEFANQISAVLLMFMPYCLISVMEKKSFINIFTLIVNVLSLFLLSTKVAIFGVLIVFVYTIFIYSFKNIVFSKNKMTFKKLYIPLIVFILYLAILPVNPGFMRINETETIEAASDVVDVENPVVNTNEAADLPNNSNDNIAYTSDLDYIEQNYIEKKIKQEFILERYPYTYDADFWISILNEPIYRRINYRYLEESIVKRVIEINNNKLDVLLGITNTRVQNIFNIEKDFVVQYYSLGIIGLILVFIPYFILLFNYLYKLIKDKFKDFDIINMLSFLTIIIIFIISYFSGNLLNSLSFTIYFAILFYLLLKNNCEGSNNL